MRQFLHVVGFALLGAVVAGIFIRGPMVMEPVIPEASPVVFVAGSCPFARAAARCLLEHHPDTLLLPTESESDLDRELCERARAKLGGGYLLGKGAFCDALAERAREDLRRQDSQVSTPTFRAAKGTWSDAGLSFDGFELVGATTCARRFTEYLDGGG